MEVSRGAHQAPGRNTGQIKRVTHYGIESPLKGDLR